MHVYKRQWQYDVRVQLITHRKRKRAPLLSFILDFHIPVSSGRAALLHDSLLGDTRVLSHSSSPLHYCTVCKRLHRDVGAQAALGEHADSALISKNRWNTSTGAALEEEERWEYDVRSAAQTWLVGDVSKVKMLSFFRLLNMDMPLRRGKEAPAVPVPLFDHIRNLPFRCKFEQRWSQSDRHNGKSNLWMWLILNSRCETSSCIYLP